MCSGPVPLPPFQSRVVLLAEQDTSTPCCRGATISCVNHPHKKQGGLRGSKDNSAE
jgi:hypothetical protein